MSQKSQISLFVLVLFLLATLGSLCAGLYFGSTLQGDYAPPTVPPPVSSDPIHNRTNVAEILSIETQEELLQLRQGLVNYIWSGSGFPTDLAPSQMEESMVPAEALPPGLERVDRLTMSMPNGVTSVVQVFYPTEANGHLVLFHEGHGGKMSGNSIDFFLQNKYTIAVLKMPLYGENSKPIVYFPRFGYVRLDTHDHLRLLRTSQFSPIRYFMEPVAVTINHLTKQQPFKSINMVGLSGGAWTTALYAAIDPRIQTSVPVSGTLPFYLRSSRAHDRGDYEQTDADLYRIANRLELYVLAAAGKDRQQLQIFSRDDPCCFGGERSLLYEQHVGETVQALGPGEFRVWIDTKQAEHGISDASLSMIDQAISKQ